MTALVYSAEIEREYECTACAENPDVYASRGRCTGAPEGPMPLPVWVRDKDGHERKHNSFFEVEDFGVCPRALTRHDLNGDGMTTAVVVLHASQANVRSRWPDVPAKLMQLVGTLERAKDLRDLAIIRAQRAKG